MPQHESLGRRISMLHRIEENDEGAQLNQLFGLFGHPPRYAEEADVIQKATLHIKGKKKKK